MNQSEKEVNAELIWMMVFAVIPMVVAANYAEAFTTEGGMTEALFAGVLGGAGASLGFGVFYITKGKNVVIKVVSLIVLWAVVLAPIRFITSETSQTAHEAYSTCAVCGYAGFKEEENFCYNCAADLSDEKLAHYGLQDKNELIRFEQISFFIPEQQGEPVDFYRPEISEDGFKKDKNWKPLIPKDTVEKHALSFYKFSRENHFDIEVLEAGQ